MGHRQHIDRRFSTAGAIAGALFVLAGCGAPSVMLANDKGHYVRCEMQGFWTGGGGPFAYAARNKCIQDYEAVGYRRVTPHAD